MSGNVTAHGHETDGTPHPIRVDAQGRVLIGAGGAVLGGGTIADGADTALGAVADAIVAAGAVGTLSAKLRRVTQGLEDLKAQAKVEQTPIAAANADVAVPGANAAAIVTYAAAPNLKHVISGVAWSYIGGIPSGGNLLVTDAGVTVFSMDIPDQGAGFIVFPHPKINAAVNTAMVVTLAAGGVAITGKVSVLNHWTE